MKREMAGSKRRALALFLSAALLLSCAPASVRSVRADGGALSAASGAAFAEVYEAEDAALSGTAVGTALDDYSGCGYVDGLPPSARITFAVDAAAAGEYGVRLRYTNGTGSAKSVGVYVNGVKIRDSNLASTINGTTWSVQLENLKLNQGANTITYENGGANNCDAVRFDKISLSWMYEAENTAYAARLGGIGQDVDNHPGYSGTQGNSDIAFQNQGQGLRFTVSAPAAGDYSLVIRYGCGFDDNNARSLSGYVNGAKIKTIQFATMRDWNTWADNQWTIKLNAGQNTVTIQVDSGDSANINIDYITLKPVQWTYAGDVTGVSGNNSKLLTFKLDNPGFDAEVEVESVGRNAVKVWLEPYGKFERKYDSFSVVNESVDPQNLDAADKGGYYQIDAGDMFVDVQKNPFKVTYLDKSGDILCDNEDQSMGWTADGELTVNSALQSDEQFWGLGEKIASFNRRGTDMAMWSHDAYGDILNSSVPATMGEGRYYMSNPYFVSSKGYSILFDNSSRTVFDLGKSSGDEYSFGTYNPNPGGELVYYFIYGPQIKQITKTFTDIVGKTFFAPEWAYGNIQCHYGYTQNDVMNVAQTYRDKQIPLDMMMADIEWYDTQCTPTAWNRNDFPNPAAMLSALKNLNVRMGLIDDPNVSAEGSPTPPDYVAGNSAGYFVKSQTGSTKQVKWPWGQSYGNRGAGNSGLTDFFNPGARTWWGNQHNMVLSQGVEAFWMDMNEPAKYNTDWLFWNKPGKAYGTISDVKNAYAIMANQAMYDKLHENGGRSLLLTRSGYTGTQRYASPWTGDIGGDYTSMSQQINLGTSLSMTGYNYWGFDIGGFFTNIDDKTYKRWIELSTFIPIHRFHYCSGVEAKEPWTHNSEGLSRDLIDLRYTLEPYMYSLTADNILGIGIEKGLGPGGTGIPYARPMVMEYPDDPNTWNMDTEFMAGPSFLVAPVTQNADTKDVYLPAGHWYDYFNPPIVYDGGRTMTYEAPADVLPVFVKEGSIIPMQPVMQYMGEKPVDLLTLDVYPLVSPGSFNFALYEDDGATDSYKNGVYATTDYNCDVSASGDVTSYRFDIGARKGAYADIASRDYMLDFHGGDLKGISVRLGDTALSAAASLGGLKALPAGYYIDTLRDICYVKFHDTGLAASVTVSGVKAGMGSMEFEDGVLTGGAITGDSAGGFSGTGYVTGLTSASDTASVDFIQSASGLYPVYIRYNSGADTALNVTCGDETVTVPLSGRNTWEETVALLNLAKGPERVTVSGAGSSGAVMIDCLRIPDQPYALPASKNTAEAEDSQLLGGVNTASSYAGFTGTGYVTNLLSAGDGVTFSGVNVEKAGRYAVKLIYRDDSQATGTLHMFSNGQSADAVAVSLPRFRPQLNTVAWYQATATLDLRAGDNTVTALLQPGDNGAGISLDSLYYPQEPTDLQEVPVINGGFETGGTGGWTLSPSVSGSYGVDTYDAILENYKFYYYNGGAATAQKLYQTAGGLANGSYLVAFWAKVYNSPPNKCQLQLTGYDGVLETDYDLPYNPDWVHYSLPVDVKDGSLTFGFYYNAPAGASLQLDGVRLWRVVSYDPYLRDALGVAIAEDAALKRSDYTADSFNDFQAALQLARSWYADSATTPNQLAAALNLLGETRAALRPYAAGYAFDTRLVGGQFVPSFVNNSGSAVSGVFCLAIYGADGRLAHVQGLPFAAAAGASVSGVFSVRAADYPADRFSYKAFCWDLNYAPLAPAVTDFGGF